MQFSLEDKHRNVTVGITTVKSGPPKQLYIKVQCTEYTHIMLLNMLLSMLRSTDMNHD